jgi:hypothetical protein
MRILTFCAAVKSFKLLVMKTNRGIEVMLKAFLISKLDIGG